MVSLFLSSRNVEISNRWLDFRKVRLGARRSPLGTQPKYGVLLRLAYLALSIMGQRKGLFEMHSSKKDIILCRLIEKTDRIWELMALSVGMQCKVSIICALNSYGRVSTIIH